MALYPESHTGRVVPIPPAADEPYRTPWRRDYARLIHSAAFRRLQGKTQLFPGSESDFFRNRLTHSLEVAQIAKSIAIRINNTHDYFKTESIDTDLVETAALAHDLGHPPFGHNGEMALDKCMRTDGGFEGNAQSLRILSKLEKRQTRTLGGGGETPLPILNGHDNRAGLNLTYRTLAAVLKYDNEIAGARDLATTEVEKGYYYTERDLVRAIKGTMGVLENQKLRTIECSIMDVADDIAYSTYDLEDSFKARFLTPTSMLAIDQRILEAVAAEVQNRLKKNFPTANAEDLRFSPEDVQITLVGTFKDIFRGGEQAIDESKSSDWQTDLATAYITTSAVSASNQMVESGYYRAQVTSDLVGTFIKGVSLNFNDSKPYLSTANLDISTFSTVEVLKNFAYQALILSPMLKVAEYRGKDIISQIFKTLTADQGYRLMPSDFQELYRELKEPSDKRRVVCDFIAGMTDRYAIQFYGRLFGTNPETIFSPL